MTRAATVADLHRAFVRDFPHPSQHADWDPNHKADLRRVAKVMGASPELIRDASRAFVLDSWDLERDANAAREWLDYSHPGAPTDLEGFASYFADSMYRHLDREVAVAKGRDTWFGAVMFIPRWEAFQAAQAARSSSMRRAA